MAKRTDVLVEHLDDDAEVSTQGFVIGLADQTAIMGFVDPGEGARRANLGCNNKTAGVPYRRSARSLR